MGELETASGRDPPTVGAGSASDDWFDVKRIRSDLYVFTDWLGDSHPRFGPILTHSYLLLGSRRAALIDSGLGIGDLRHAVGVITDLPVDVLLTHNHSDHIGGAFAFDRVSIATGDADQLAQGLSEQDAEFVREYPARSSRNLPSGFDFAQHESRSRWAHQPCRSLSSGDTVELGGHSLRVLTTPGHTPGSCCYLERAHGLLFTGDTAYEGTLNLQLDRSDLGVYPRSIESLLTISQGMLLLPGHYATPAAPGIIRAIHDGLSQLALGTVSFQEVAPDWLEADFKAFSVTVPSSARCVLSAETDPTSLRPKGP